MILSSSLSVAVLDYETIHSNLNKGNYIIVDNELIVTFSNINLKSNTGQNPHQ